MLDAAGPGAGGAEGPTLAVAGLEAWYGESHLLHGGDLHIREAEVVTLLVRVAK